MLSLLFRILLVICVLWLLRRFLGNLLGAPKGAGGDSQQINATPNNMVKDPVCGMYMDSRLAVRVEGRKQSFYFCSEECKNKYLGKSSTA